MTGRELERLRDLLGRQVGVALADGSRIDDCQLVSVRHNSTRAHLWLFSNGDDLFVPADQVRDIWEIRTTSRGRAA
jgi:hypothetical protein